MYTKEMTKLIGEAYYEVLKILNGAKHDPYISISDMYPMKCLIMLYPKAVTLGTTKKLDEIMTKLMGMITPEQMSTIIKKPMPREMVLYLEMGKNKAALGDKWK